MPANHPNQISARTRGLGIELRKLRLNADLNTRNAAKQVGIMSPATLNRIEMGTRQPSPEEVSALLVVYGVTGLEREDIMDLTRDAVMSAWWDNNWPRGASKHLRALIHFESTATRMTCVQHGFVPGLLQIPAYMRALMASFDVPEDEIERRVSIRVGRQVVLSKPNPPQYLAIIDESVLRRPFGDAEQMAEQVRHLGRSANQGNVEVLVIPFERGSHQGLVVSYDLYEFAKAPTTVFIELRSPSVFLDKHEDVIVFRDTIHSLRKVALGPADSLEFLESVASGYERR
jgi:transcriptional regulator with XRE-family HTH domain